jgi:hypothetical protein
MLATPASTAAAPRVRSQACWNPAVPPPPAAGAAEGRPVDPLCAPGVVDDPLCAPGVVDDPLCAPGVVDDPLCAPAVVVSELCGVLLFAEAPLLWPEATGGPGDGDPPGEGVEAEQADTAAEMSIAKVAQPMMASIALSLTRATAGRTFMEPPHASQQVAALFSGYSTRNRYRRGARVTTGRWPKAGPRKPAATRVKPIDGGHTMK